MRATSWAASFTVGAALPLGVAWLVDGPQLVTWVAALSIAFLAVLGALAARAGGAKVLPSAWRVTLWGALAMGVTAAAGSLFSGVA